MSTVIGESDNIGVIGTSTGGHFGVSGVSSDAHGGIGVNGLGSRTGVRGLSGTTGVAESVDGIGVQGAGSRIGVEGFSADAGCRGVYGHSVNGTGVSGRSVNYIGVYGHSEIGLAGVFAGDVSVTGTLTKTLPAFKIDHPLDPANKYLFHSGVESSDMKNLYDGVAKLDEQGCDLPVVLSS